MLERDLSLPAKMAEFASSASMPAGGLLEILEQQQSKTSNIPTPSGSELRKVVNKPCPRCQGKHRAHTCGKAMVGGGLSKRPSANVAPTVTPVKRKVAPSRFEWTFGQCGTRGCTLPDAHPGNCSVVELGKRARPSYTA